MQHVIHSLQIYQVKGDIHSNTYRKFLLFLITRFSKYICNQVPGKETATFIYLDYNSEMCLFCKISNDCVKISLLFCLLLLDLSLHATNEGERSLVGIYLFSIHHHSHCLQPRKNLYSFALTLVHCQIHCHCQTDLSLFSSQHSLFLLPLLPPHYRIQHFSSFCQISLKQHHYLTLQHRTGSVPFLQLPAERSITNRGDNCYSQIILQLVFLHQTIAHFLKSISILNCFKSATWASIHHIYSLKNSFSKSLPLSIWKKKNAQEKVTRETAIKYINNKLPCQQMPVRSLQSSFRPTYYSEVLDTHSYSRTVKSEQQPLQKQLCSKPNLIYGFSLRCFIHTEALI